MDSFFDHNFETIGAPLLLLALIEVGNISKFLSNRIPNKERGLPLKLMRPGLD